jgi:hypothetical protein
MPTFIGFMLEDDRVGLDFVFGRAMIMDRSQAFTLFRKKLPLLVRPKSVTPSSKSREAERL